MLQLRRHQGYSLAEQYWDSVLTLASPFRVWLCMKSASPSSCAEKVPLRSQQNLSLMKKNVWTFLAQSKALFYLSVYQNRGNLKPVQAKKQKSTDRTMSISCTGLKWTALEVTTSKTLIKPHLNGSKLSDLPVLFRLSKTVFFHLAQKSSVKNSWNECAGSLWCPGFQTLWAQKHHTHCHGVWNEM